MKDNKQQGKPQSQDEPKTAFIPCDENDPDLVGGFTATDGQSLCYVKEIQLPSIPTEVQKEECVINSFIRYVSENEYFYIRSPYGEFWYKSGRKDTPTTDDFIKEYQQYKHNEKEQ